MGEFKDYCNALFGEYNNNIRVINKESTNRLMELIRDENLEVVKTKKIFIGKFYYLRYDYNGNKIWCPVFVLGEKYKTDTQKRIIEVINLEYLPYNIKIELFDILFDLNKDIISYNKDLNYKNQNAEKEKQILNISERFNSLLDRYKYSKTFYNFLKIKELYVISTNFAPRFMFVDTLLINLKSMRDLSLILEDYDMKNRLNIVMNELLSIQEDLNKGQYNNYLKRLRNLERKYKLFENKK